MEENQIMTLLQQLDEKINYIGKKIQEEDSGIAEDDDFLNTETKNIAIALAKFQAEVSNPSNSKSNPFFNSKYAPLEEVLNAVRPLLAKYGLSFIQIPKYQAGHVGIQTVLFHETGEKLAFPTLYIRSEKNTAQGIGSAITYARRYSLSSILGVASEDDDDGNVATQGQAMPKR